MLALREIGERVGRSEEGVRQALQRAGYTIGGIRAVRCSFCGAPLPPGQYRSGHLHRCGTLACERAYRRHLREARRPRPVCQHCGRVLGRTPSGEPPHFCRLPACRAAYQRHRWATDPAYRAARSASTAAWLRRSGTQVGVPSTDP